MLSQIRDIITREGVNDIITPNFYKFIEQVNERLLQSVDRNIPLGLTNGKIGLTIYLFIIGRETGNESYINLAEGYLDEIYSDLKQKSSRISNNELVELALGIHYLVANKYASGNIDVVLAEFDNIIFKNLTFSTNQEINPFSLFEPFELMLSLYYFYNRLRHFNGDSDLDYFYKELIIKIVNHIHLELSDDLQAEPFLFSINYLLPSFVFVLSKLLSLNFYNYRLMKIVEELSDIILSTLPILHSHRLFLLWSMSHLREEFFPKNWQSHMHILRENIDINMILKAELKDKDVFIADGASGVYFLLTDLARNLSVNRIEFDSNDFFEKIIFSEIWDSFTNIELSNFNYRICITNGFPSLIITLGHIVKMHQIKN